MNKLILVYITCSSVSEAKSIGIHILEKRLAACINIFSSMESMSLWPPKSGKIESANESVVIAKTIPSKISELEKEVLKIHSYETPAIIFIPAQKTNKKYLDWIVGELS